MTSTRPSRKKKGERGEGGKRQGPSKENRSRENQRRTPKSVCSSKSKDEVVQIPLLLDLGEPRKRSGKKKKGHEKGWPRDKSLYLYEKAKERPDDTMAEGSPGSTR